LSSDTENVEPKGRLAFWILAAALTPPLAAIWTHPGFVTQDGPAHLYNAHILALSFDPTSPFRQTFEVRWDPLPNWAGSIVSMALVSTLPPRAADRAMTSLSLVAFATAITWLRWKVAGQHGLAQATLAASLIAMNVAWLLGFASFLLGACLFPLTLGIWWSARDLGFSWRRVLLLAALTVLGYFCHLVSLGLTVVGVLLLESLTPGRRRWGRALTTAAGLAPLAVLIPLYMRMIHRGGHVAPSWRHLPNVFSPRAWLDQLTWVDPISLARKDYLPMAQAISPWFNLAAPVLWLSAALLIAFFELTLDERQIVCERRGWWLLAMLLIVGGIGTPDTLGPSHGDYLPQRVVLLGVVALVAVLPFRGCGWKSRMVTAGLTGGLIIQSLIVWDYADTSERTAGQVLRSGAAVGSHQRVATLLSAARTPFRSNALLHSDCGLGIGNGNIIWSNYETNYYYFPVQFRSGVGRPDAALLQEISLSDDPRDAEARVERWSRLLELHHDHIDRLLVWGVDPAMDVVTNKWFELETNVGPVRVFRPATP
jgi:hypothetical protein